MKRNKEEWLCKKCKKDTLLKKEDYYMLDDFIWKRICEYYKMKNHKGMLCFKCMQKAFRKIWHRRLIVFDFTMCQSNFGNPRIRKLLINELIRYLTRDEVRYLTIKTLGI